MLRYVIESQDDQLMPLVVHNEDVFAIGQDGEIVQVFAGRTSSRIGSAEPLDERQGAATLRLATHSVRPSSRTPPPPDAQPGGQLFRSLIALGEDGATEGDNEANSRCSEKSQRLHA